ncbi:MAG: VWA domain-containing protein [Gemmatimonadaceae bacterium]|jgi:hypothetical protein|nr:VWA domain-containing protein [Gemmatimonadaceae bacterium]
MTLLAPWLLALAAAIGVPIFVHLSRRRRDERIAFPALRYLETAEREQRRQRDVQQRVLLALRLLALLALALAAARPLVTWLSGRPALALAIVLDNSMSTARRTPAAAADRGGEGTRAGEAVFEALRRDAHALLEAQAAGARLWLVTADGRVRTGSASALRVALDSVRPFAGAGALREALVRARRLVASAPELAPAIAVLTDGQATALDTSTITSAVPTVALARRERAPLGTPSLLAGEGSAFVRDVRVTPRRWTGQGTVAFRVDGDSVPGDTIAWRVLLDSTVVARGVARRGTEVTTTVGTTTRGWVSGAVALNTDALPLDDVRPFAVDVRPATEVRVDPTAGAFVAAAVATLRDARLIGTGSGTSAIPLVRADVASTVPAVLFAPASPAAIAPANRNLARLGIPWQFGAVVGDSAIARVRDSVLAAGAASPIRVDRRVRLIPVASATARATDTIATVGAEPWIVAGAGYLLVSSPLDPFATSLVLSAGFVPWLGARLSAGLDAAQPVWNAHPFAPVAADFPCDSVRAPRGDALVLARDLADVRRGPPEPGVYLCARGARSAALVITTEPEESVGTTMDDATLRARLGSTRARVVTQRTALVDAIATQPGGRSAVPWLLALAVVALLLESLVARRGLPRVATRTTIVGAPA